MRLCWVVVIGEEQSSCCWLSISNRPLLIILASLQLSVALVSLGQHLFSWTLHSHIFFCQSNITEEASLDQHFLAYDMIIFDYGLMHRILGTTECVANYLDGGYMRAMWCVEHATALGILLLTLYCLPRPTWLLWPALLLQSSFCLGMTVLSMAIAPKVLEAFGAVVDSQLLSSFLIYATGFSLNWMFTFILWHHFWFIERMNHLYYLNCQPNDPPDDINLQLRYEANAFSYAFQSRGARCFN